MLNDWGYTYFYVGLGLGYAELDLQNYVKWENVGKPSGHPVQIDPDNPIIQVIYTRCDEFSRLPQNQELGAIPGNLERLKAKIIAAKRRKLQGDSLLSANDILTDVERLKNDFLYVLHNSWFYSLTPQLAKLYGQPQLFGPAVAKKFPGASNDIEWAGNCLALGKPTACVLHLNRVMEIVLHRIARKLHVTPDAKDNMGSILGKMTDPIKNMPDKTETQKRKKEKWAECRTNLYHVKMAWRDPSSHGKQSYDGRQAGDILERVRAFMQQLATL